MTEARRASPEAAGTFWSSGRSGSFALSLALVCCALGLAAMAVELTDPRALGLLALAAAALVAGGRHVRDRFPSLGLAISDGKRMAGRVAATGAALLPLIIRDPYQLHVLTTAFMSALMAVGLNVTIGYAGLADFGFVAYYALGAYTSALLNTGFGLNFWLCLPLAGVAAALSSLAVAFPALRVKGHYLALVTLGFSFIVFQLIVNLQPLTGGTDGISGIEMPALFGHGFGKPLRVGMLTLPREANYYYLTLAILCVAAIAIHRLHASRWGRVWQAMRQDDIAVESAGIDLTVLKLTAFMTGSFLGGMAGSLFAHRIGFIDPTSFHIINSILLLAVVALGNWNLAGVITAAVVFSVLPEKLRAFEEFRPLIFALALLAVMLARGRRMGALAQG